MEEEIKTMPEGIDYIEDEDLKSDFKPVPYIAQELYNMFMDYEKPGFTKDHARKAFGVMAK